MRTQECLGIKSKKKLAHNNCFKVSLSISHITDSPALSTAWSTNDSAALLPKNPDRKDMFVESSAVDVCKSVCMCQCFEIADSCGFIRLELH